MNDESDPMNITREATTTIEDTGGTSSVAALTPPDGNEPKSPSMYILPYYGTEVDALHESVQSAIDLIQFYSEQAESTMTTTTTTGTTNPDEIYEQLDTARNQITESWQALYTAFHSKTDHDDDDSNIENTHRGNSPLTETEQIRIAYLNMITDSFGNVLAQLHNDENHTTNHFNIDVIADCLQSGYDLLTQFNASTSSSTSTWYENDFVWNDNDDDDNNDEDDDDNIKEEDDDDDKSITPHERHRQQLGFQIVH